MCLHQTEQMPLNTGGNPNPDDPLSATLTANRPPTTVPVQEPSPMGRAMQLLSAGSYDPTGGQDTTPELRPTKFGSLMKIVGPMMQGAAIGGLTGRSTPGGGFAGANQFYQNQRMRQMQVSQFMMEMMHRQAEMAHLQAQTEWEKRRPLLTRTANTFKGKGPDGSEVQMGQNPQTGEWEPIPGVTPEGPTPLLKEFSSDQGLMTFDTHGVTKGAVPLTLANQVESSLRSGSAESASAPSKVAQGTAVPTEFNSGSPRLPGAMSTSQSASPAAIQAASGGVPLFPPGKQFKQTAPDRAEQSIRTQHPGWTDEQVYRQLRADARKPDQGNTKPSPAAIEGPAQEAMRLSNGDPNKALTLLGGVNPAIRAQVRSRIREIARPGKPAGKQQRYQFTPQQPQPNQ